MRSVADPIAGAFLIKKLVKKGREKTMTGATLASSPLLFILVGAGLLAIIVFALYSFKKAKKRCLELGMSEETISAVVKSTISAAIIPSLAILLGFVILSVSLGVAWPWWRLSVIGSLAYETMAAQYTADGLGVALSEILSSDPTVFASVMIVMTIGIIAGPLMIAVVGEKYSTGVMNAKSGEKGEWGTIFSGLFYLAMFAVYIPIMVFTDLPTTLTLVTSMVVTVIVGMLSKKLPILAEFTMAASLIVGMASSVLWASLF